MFYAHMVLTRKGPLAKVWLAAHWDKKLTKAHVFETDVEDSVENIISPKVKMALRTSGHLLLGIVRIYSRKAKYLLADCNEAFVKIKMAFRPGMVDLPDENKEAALSAITLPEVFHNFDTEMPDLSDIDVQAQFSLNQSRAEEITMKEDYGNISLVHDDDFGGMGFDDAIISPTTREKEDGLEDDDGFGGVGISDGILGGLFDEAQNIHAVPETPRAHSPVPTPAAAGNYSDDDDDVGGYGGAGDSDDDEDAQVPPAKQPRLDVEAAAESNKENIDVSVASVPQASVSKIGDKTTDATTLMLNDQDAFALEPLDVTTVQGPEKHRPKRKRKLIVDDMKGIDGDEMRSQLSDTSDIIASLDLAPPTKQLMSWKETGGVEKLFALPGRYTISTANVKEFSKYLTTRPQEEEDIHVARAEESLLDADHTVVGEHSRIEKEKAVPSPVDSEYYGPMTPFTPGPQTPAPIDGLMDPDVPVMEPIPDEAPAMLPIDTPLHNEEPLIQVRAGDEPQLDLSTSVVAQPSREGDQQFNEDIEQEEGETIQQFEERVATKRSQQMLMLLNQALRHDDSILSFKKLTLGDTRKQAASKFYSILVLKKQQVVGVDEKEPFADISITKGPLYSSVIVT